MIVTAENISNLQCKGPDKAAEELEKLLNKAIEEAVEGTLRAIPGVIKSLVVQAAHLQNAKDEFYASNKDLSMHKDVVASAMESIETNNPGISFEKMMKILGPEARKRLKDVKTSNAVVDERPSIEHVDHLAGLL